MSHQLQIYAAKPEGKGPGVPGRGQQGLSGSGGAVSDGPPAALVDPGGSGPA